MPNKKRIKGQKTQEERTKEIETLWKKVEELELSAIPDFQHAKEEMDLFVQSGIANTIRFSLHLSNPQIHRKVEIILTNQKVKNCLMSLRVI